MVGVNVIAADTDEEAKYLFTTHQQHATRMRRNTRGQLPPPSTTLRLFDAARKNFSQRTVSLFSGWNPETVRQGLQRLVEKTGANELMITGQIFDHQARLRSFEIASLAAQVRRSLRSNGSLSVNLDTIFESCALDSLQWDCLVG